MTEYPEHERMKAVQAESQAIGEFIENGPGTLCEWNEALEEFLPISGGIEKLLAAHFNIDLDVIEAEKRDMLDKQRELNADRMPVPPGVDEFAPADEAP